MAAVHRAEDIEKSQRVCNLEGARDWNKTFC